MVIKVKNSEILRPIKIAKSILIILSEKLSKYGKPILVYRYTFNEENTITRENLFKNFLSKRISSRIVVVFFAKNFIPGKNAYLQITYTPKPTPKKYDVDISSSFIVIILLLLEA